MHNPTQGVKLCSRSYSLTMGQATAGQHSTRDRKSFHYPSDDCWKDRSPRTASRDLAFAREDDHPLEREVSQNLVEMMPLVKPLTDQQHNRTFSRHASFFYSSIPARETRPLKKYIEHPAKAKRGNGQPAQGKPGEPKELSLWENVENMYDSPDMCSEEIPMLAYPTDCRVKQKVVNNVGILQLQRQLEQKEYQLQAAERHAQQMKLQLQETVEGLQSQIHQKEQDIQRLQNALFDKQLEAALIHERLKKVEDSSQASRSKLEKESSIFHHQFALLALQLLNILSDLEVDSAVQEPESSTSIGSSMDVESVEKSNIYDAKAEYVEQIRRKYLAALIVARENPSDESLTLVVELRIYLQVLVMDR